MIVGGREKGKGFISPDRRPLQCSCLNESYLSRVVCSQWREIGFSEVQFSWCSSGGYLRMGCILPWKCFALHRLRSGSKPVVAVFIVQGVCVWSQIRSVPPPIGEKKQVLRNRLLLYGFAETSGKSSEVALWVSTQECVPMLYDIKAHLTQHPSGPVSCVLNACEGV